MSEFKREERYLVLKHKDIRYLSDDDKAALSRICQRINIIRTERGKNPLECVVVESDWPCYTAAWGLVEMVEVMQK